jgi:hypothetical protein
MTVDVFAGSEFRSWRKADIRVTLNNVRVRAKSERATAIQSHLQIGTQLLISKLVFRQDFQLEMARQWATI